MRELQVVSIFVALFTPLPIVRFTVCFHHCARLGSEGDKTKQTHENQKKIKLSRSLPTKQDLSLYKYMP